MNEQLPILTRQTLDQSVIFSQWKDIISGQNEIIGRYGDSQGIKLGTTVVAMLITQSECYIINVGDSRAYIINDDINQITQDQTFIAREIALGHMTPEQAKTDRRRNVLLQCVGASEKVYLMFLLKIRYKHSIYVMFGRSSTRNNSRRNIHKIKTRIID